MKASLEPLNAIYCMFRREFGISGVEVTEERKMGQVAADNGIAIHSSNLS